MIKVNQTTLLITALLLVLLSGSVDANEWEFSLAAGIHDERYEQPEIYLPGALGSINLDWSTALSEHWFIGSGYQHISSIKYTEQGNGLNVIWFRVGFRW